MRLLVADDHPGYRLLVRTAVSDAPEIELVAEVADLESLRSVAGAAQPDIALLDLLLPGGGGLAAAEALAQLAPGAAVIVSSAHSMEELDTAGPAGGIGFLSKGVSPRDLPAALLDLAGTLRRTEPPIEAVDAAFPAVPQSSGAARRFVADTLARWGCEDLADSARLLISELVSNAILHAGSDVTVGLHLLVDRVRFEVIDHSAKPMRRREATDDDTSGRGSELIDLLARAWGMSGRADGKCIWFELDRIPAD